MSRRTDMLGSTIQRELAGIIQHELDDPRLEGGFVSITRVKVSPDVSSADVFVTIMGTPGAQTAALNALKHSAGMMRSRLTKSLSLRVAPYIKFHHDEQLKKELNVLNLLDKVTKEDAQRLKAAGGEASNGEASNGDASSEEAYSEECSSAVVDDRKPDKITNEPNTIQE